MKYINQTKKDAGLRMDGLTALQIGVCVGNVVQ